MPVGYLLPKATIINDIIIISTVTNLCVTNWEVICLDEKYRTEDGLVGNNLFLITQMPFVRRHKG